MARKRTSSRPAGSRDVPRWAMVLAVFIVAPVVGFPLVMSAAPSWWVREGPWTWEVTGVAVLGPPSGPRLVVVMSSGTGMDLSSETSTSRYGKVAVVDLTTGASTTVLADNSSTARMVTDELLWVDRTPQLFGFDVGGERTVAIDLATGAQTLDSDALIAADPTVSTIARTRTLAFDQQRRPWVDTTDGHAYQLDMDRRTFTQLPGGQAPVRAYSPFTTERGTRLGRTLRLGEQELVAPVEHGDGLHGKLWPFRLISHRATETSTARLQVSLIEATGTRRWHRTEDQWLGARAASRAGRSIVWSGLARETLVLLIHGAGQSASGSDSPSDVHLVGVDPATGDVRWVTAL